MVKVIKHFTSVFVALVTAGSVLLMSAPYPVLAEDPPPEISIFVPSLTSWTLSPEAEQPMEKTGELRVTTSYADGKTWRVLASDEDTDTAGHMTEYSVGVYNTGVKLSDAMQIVGPDGTATLPAAGTVVTGSGTVTDQPYNIDFDQTVEWSDPISASYRIVVTFTAEFTN
jgi:hypothetical protein